MSENEIESWLDEIGSLVYGGLTGDKRWDVLHFLADSGAPKEFAASLFQALLTGLELSDAMRFTSLAHRLVHAPRRVPMLAGALAATGLRPELWPSVLEFIEAAKAGQ